MNDSGLASAEQLFQGILSGQVPRQVRLFAAQGLLPLSREDIFRLQTVLSADSDVELAQLAAKSLSAEEPGTISGWLKNYPVSPIELDLIGRVIRDEGVWGAVAAHKSVSDETLCWLAHHATPMVQDIIVTNQVRLLNCMEILEALRENPQVAPVVMRRVREFEEEFIEKVIAGVADAELEIELEALTIEETVSGIKEIGGHIPAEDELPYQHFEDPALVDEVERRGVSAFANLLQMDIKGKIQVALKGTREERAILINSRNKLVLRSVLASPKLNDSEVEKFAASRSVSDEVQRVILANPRWLRQYGIVLALVQNPKTPIQAAIRMLPRLSVRDLKKIAIDRNLSSTLQRQARMFMEKGRR